METQCSLMQKEIQRRLPTISNIGDDEIRTETMELALDAPEYFWEIPASTSGYHHPACREDHGLWAHTLMLTTVVEELIPSLRKQGLITDRGADMARAAALLHDQYKNGDPAEGNGKSTSDHDIQMAERIREESELPEQVAEAVESHMGPWYDGPAPESPVERLVHHADMMASTANVTVALPKPVPEELSDLDVPHADV